MLLALSENTLIAPKKNTTGICPLCSGVVISKCGEINIHHWAHKQKEECDSWSEPETYWHKSWKEAFPIENREVVMEKDGKRHFADIYTDSEVVIELQNSSISSQTILQRESFYGSRLLWIINGSKYRSRISFWSNEKIREIKERKNIQDLYSEISLSDDNINEFLATSKEFNFNWSYPIRSWRNSKRPVFLDIDEDYILWFYEGIGTNYGSFKVYSKKIFFEKYLGDYEKYKEINKRENLYNYKSIVDALENLAWSYKPEFTSYSYPPRTSLKINDNMSKKTVLNKVRPNELIIPNGNGRGVFFLFCYDIEDRNILSLFIDYAKSISIRNNILPLISYDEEKSIYTVSDKWVLDYIASIPLNENDTIRLSNHYSNYLNSNIIREVNKVEDEYQFTLLVKG